MNIFQFTVTCTYLRQDEGLAWVLEGSLQRKLPHINELQQVTPIKRIRYNYYIAINAT